MKIQVHRTYNAVGRVHLEPGEHDVKADVAKWAILAGFATAIDRATVSVDESEATDVVELVEDETPEAVDVSNVDYDIDWDGEYTAADLRGLLFEAGIDFPNRVNKPELIELCQRAYENGELAFG